MKSLLCQSVMDAGFVGARILSPFISGVRCRDSAPSLLVAALPYGNRQYLSAIPPHAIVVAPFARRNYYREATRRLHGLSSVFRSRYGGVKADYQILCNSPVPEKPLAAAAGTGSLGRNGLIITRDAGSLVIIAAMTLPFVLPGDSASAPFDLCVDCGNNPPCISACPTGALPGDGTLNRQRCIQWYASGHETTVPDDVSRHWGNRLYGCTDCQDACVHNRRPITGVETTEGMLPDYFDAQELLAMDDGTLQARFKGSVLGGKWLGPAALRRNIREAVQGNG